MSHKCSTLVLSCIDFRFQTSIRNFLVNKGSEKNYDLLTRPGGSKDIDQQLVDNIALSVKLHGVNKVLVIHHQNCGAYGDSLTSGTPEEFEKHGMDMKNNVELLKEKFPGLGFETYFAKLDGEVVESVIQNSIRQPADKIQNYN